MQMPSYILVADSGQPTQPMLQIVIDAETVPPAINEAKRLATALFPIYHRFGLFKIGEVDKEIWRFRLERTAPEITTLHEA